MKKCYRVLFNFFSVLFLLSLVLFYGYRLVHYYILEHKSLENEVIPFSEKLIAGKAIDGTNKGLQTTDEGYMYASASDNNYVYYLGKLWRIISIDKNNNIKLITEDIQTVLNWDKNDKFNESNINKWLNKGDDDYSGVFEKSLKNETLMKQDGKVATLLTKKEYELLGEKNYLNIDDYFWITDENGAPLYIKNGKIISEETDGTYGVRPVIVLPNSINYLAGTGMESDPYIIKYDSAEKINNLYIGTYVKFASNIWRIIDIDETSVGLVLNETIEYDGKYSDYDNIFSTKEGVGNYLNNDFYENLANNQYILEHNYNIGGYGINNKYDYMTKYDDTISAYVGLLSIGDFYINEKENTYTMTPFGNTKKTIYVIDESKNLYADFVTSKYKVRPVIYVDPELFVISGKGTLKEPYEVGR